MFESIFETVNSGFAQALYEDYLRDPASVPPEWRSLFDNGMKGEEPDTAKSSPAATTVQEADTNSTETSVQTTPIKGPALRLLRNMEESLSLPTATSFRELDVSVLWAQRSAFNRQLETRGLRLSFTHLIGWAIVGAAQNFPSMVHAVAGPDGDPERFDPGRVNLGLAVDVERKDGSRGLMVPVIKAADQMSFAEFHQEYERLVLGARTAKLLPDAYQGATITLTNPGTIGTTASVPRLMKGQGSIIATGAIRDVAGRKTMTITSTYDHRIIQGAESGMFLRNMEQLITGEDGFYEHIASALGVSVPTDLTPPPSAAPRVAPPQPAGVGAVPSEMVYHLPAAMSLVKAHRTHGHMAAKLDPLGTAPRGDPALEPEPLGLTPEVMAAIPAKALRVYVPGENLAEALPRLRETYCGTIAYEIEHIADHQERLWLRQVIESGEHRKTLGPKEKRTLLTHLTKVDTLERFLHRSYLGHKRFGIEGLDALVPMIGAAITYAMRQGANEVVIGMAHRGRLNVLTHILGRPYETLLAEFEGGRRVEETLTPKGGTGDVKYHHGATGEFTTASGKTVRVYLMPNPSHLEAVNPVVVGTARARQTSRDSAEARLDHFRVLPILLHGDAAFAAQGVVGETFNLERLEGYGTGGTLHVITNNQIGFTTNPGEGRSTEYASDLAKGFDVPIIHVNADDAEACIAAVRLSMMYREKFHGDCVIDLVGYRRHGHNEGDEPRYTQPLMYQRIDEHPTARELYAEALVKEGSITEDAAQKEAEAQYDLLVSTQEKLRSELSELEEGEGGEEGEEPQRISGAWAPVQEPVTAVPAEILTKLNEELLSLPDGFTPNRKLMRQLERRRNALGEEPTIDWGHAEALALASILVEGTPIRLTGQDTARGTFSQRHLVLHDSDTGRQYAPLQHLSEARAPLELHNSPLSEYAALGFEYGYSVAAPEALVLWEAQFGDFVNSAEVIIDQFVVAGLAKWGQTARLVLLLPHGYEGQGPEHSSARLERFLALGAQGNIRVSNCSTPAQYFHLLRRQAKIDEVRPLILMTPKSLLRLPLAASRLADLTDGEFQKVIDDAALPGERDEITRLVLCSGKVFYDVIGSDARSEAKHVAVARIELLYPFPEAEAASLLDSYPNLRELVWLQEEPYNMGARKSIVPQLADIAREGVQIRGISRPESSSPAEGYPAAHQEQQSRLVAEALA